MNAPPRRPTRGFLLARQSHSTSFSAMILSVSLSWRHHQETRTPGSADGCLCVFVPWWFIGFPRATVLLSHHCSISSARLHGMSCRFGASLPSGRDSLAEAQSTRRRQECIRVISAISAALRELHGLCILPAVPREEGGLFQVHNIFFLVPAAYRLQVSSGRLGREALRRRCWGSSWLAPSISTLQGFPSLSKSKMILCSTATI